MSDQDNMFNGTPEVKPEVKEQPTNEVPEFLREWVGDGKKYNNLEDALKSIPAAQSHIEKLESEAKNRPTEEQLKEKNEQLMADLEEKLLAQMAAKTQQAEPAKASIQPEDDQSGGVDIATVVDTMLSKREMEKRAKDNQMSVVTSAVAKWGEQAEATLYGEAAKLGMTPQALDAFAAQNPKAVFKMLGFDSAPTNTNRNLGSTLNTQSGGGATAPMPDKPSSFDLWGNDDYLAKHVREIEAHMISTGEITKQ